MALDSHGRQLVLVKSPELDNGQLAHEDLHGLYGSNAACW